MKQNIFSVVLLIIISSYVILPSKASAQPRWNPQSEISMQKSGGGGGTPAENVNSFATPFFTFQYLLLKQTVALWSDGRGDVILERNIRNIGTVSGNNTTWYFDWYPGVYSKIRAWDAEGPLEFSTSQSGTRIFITVFFRRPIQPSQTYDFSLAVTIANMASGSGNNWNAYWYTAPGFPVQTFIQGVAFPSNSTFQFISPTPTVQKPNYLEWQYSNTPSNWVNNIDIDYTLSNTISVPVFLQTAPAIWAQDTYGNYSNGDTVNTISEWGCWMTGAAMIVDYWAQRNSTSFHTNPRTLNTWLRQNQGYDASHGVVHAKVAKYAMDNNVPLYYQGIISGRNDVVLNDYMLSGNPVIIRVSNSAGGTHFVVATGKTIQNGQSTYLINDPIYGATTLLSKYQNSYSGIVLYSGTPADPRTLRISAHSPVELVVTDPMGRKSGFDPRINRTWNEIPNAIYMVQSIAPANGPNTSALEAKFLEIISPLDGGYQVDIIGTGQGPYEIDTFASDWLGRISKQVQTGNAVGGSVDHQSINFSSYSGTGMNADVQAKISGNNMDNYSIPPGFSISDRYGINGGPVKVTSTNGKDIFAGQRAIFGSSFNSIVGYPADQLTTDYWFTSYDDLGMITYLVIGNPHATLTAEVDVYIGGVKRNATPYSIAPGQRIFPRYGINAGPVHVVSTNGVKIFTSERTKFGQSFNEVMGYPGNQLTTDYWFTSYDDIGMITYLVVGNPHPSNTAEVDVYIAGVKKNATPYSIAPGQRIFPRYAINAGPVHVVSTNGVDIFTSERSKFGQSFNEVLGYAGNQLTTDYWFTSYDDASMITYLVIGNPHATLTAEVDVYINGIKKNATPYSIAPGQRVFPRYGVNSGPVHVVSTNGVDIFTSERAKYLNSFNEILGLADNQLTTDYWFTSYDDLGMSTELVISAP